MSDSRHADRRRARRRPPSNEARSSGARRFPVTGWITLLAGAAVLGATVTVVINGRQQPVAKTAPVAAEVTLETTLWKSGKVTKATSQVENTPLELGTRFKAARDGVVAGMRFYKPAAERGTHRGTLWDSKGKPLAKVTFTGESKSGWQQAMFDAPVPIVAGRVYTVSYHTSNGGYVASPGVFDEPVTVGPLTAQAGVFGTTARSAFPSNVHKRRVSYWVDVIFRHRERRHFPRPGDRPTDDPTIVPTTSTGPSATPSTEVSATPSSDVTTGPTASGSPSPSSPATAEPTPTRTRTAGPSATPKPSGSASASPKPATPRPSLSPNPTNQPTKEPSATPKPSTTPPPTGGFPGAGDTGVPNGVTLKESGSVTVTKDGTVIDGLLVNGEINVQADNVTIRNTRVAAAPGEWGVIQRNGHGGLTVEDTEIFGNGKQRTQFGIINQGGDLTVRRVDIHTISNGILTEQGLIEDSYLHDPKYYSGDHTDMIMCTSGPPSGAKLVIRGNTVINTLEQTGAIALFQDFGVVRNVTVEGNFLAGGGYSLYGGAGSKGTSSNIKVVGNVFSKDVWAKGGYNGPVAYWDKNGSGNEWRDNVWEDGKPVPAGG
ncbi:hypothetical protein Sme01_21980 [Sphaerisporangium melleum]|uniref:DUF4082 domain-containing protein n=1 Tax=Sphaerisporangium melleum TaxID=321316 RepID=A0A917R093_9ACTN|nr:hypothetical protein GCM10007964_22400 [Sphaerisporangium melleum]GII69722.1 hypothetical protein Sme01_21980 [Sphaerisporangium melleum]